MPCNDFNSLTTVCVFTLFATVSSFHGIEFLFSYISPGCYNNKSAVLSHSAEWLRKYQSLYMCMLANCLTEYTCGNRSCSTERC